VTCSVVGHTSGQLLLRPIRGASCSERRVQLPGGTHTDHIGIRILGSIGLWGRGLTVTGNLYLLQLQVLVVAGDGDGCDGLMQLDQSVSLHLKAHDRSDNLMPFSCGQN